MQSAGRVEIVRPSHGALTTPQRQAIRRHSIRVLLSVVASFASIMGSTSRASTLSHYAPTEADNALLEQVQQRGLRYFVEQSDPETGLTRDRTRTSGVQGRAPASLAATGFSLTAWCIGDSRGWVPTGEATRYVRKTLRFALEHVEEEHGWFYHYVDARTGERDDDCEVSTIDTALFLQGALFAREYLHDEKVTALANAIYRRIDWHWALNGGQTLSMGWRPETGFIPYRWDSYCELMGMYLLGMGAPRHALPAASWDAWTRGPRVPFGGRTFIQCGPLFTHQYSHAWFDFRGLRDEYANYWQNSVDATLAQQSWSAAQKVRFPHWSRDMWGLTASDGPRGYMAWGTPGPDKDQSDGTLVPCAPGGSLPFAPRECLTSLRKMLLTGGSAVWGRYGFADAFNPETGWVSRDVIGIDVGIMVIMAENLRSGMVWETFMKAPEVRRAMRLARFGPESQRPRPTDQTVPPPTIATVQRKSDTVKVASNRRPS